MAPGAVTGCAKTRPTPHPPPPAKFDCTDVLRYSHFSTVVGNALLQARHTSTTRLALSRLQQQHTQRPLHCCLHYPSPGRPPHRARKIPLPKTLKCRGNDNWAAWRIALLWQPSALHEFPKWPIGSLALYSSTFAVCLFSSYATSFRSPVIC